VSDSAPLCPFAGRGCVRFCQCIQKGCPLFGVSKRGATDARSVDVRCGGVGPRGNQGENNMERRKFLIGMGSLAVGGAAVTGTGALTQQKSTRAFDAAVVADDQAMLKFDLSDSSLENTEYASYENGSLQLHFDENADLSNEGWAGQGDGLNPDSTVDFDNVFQIQNATADNLHINIDKSNLDNPDKITFYGHWTNGILMGSRDSDWNGQVNSGTGVNIGVRIETPDSIDDGWETGYIVIEANDMSDQTFQTPEQ